MKKKYSFKQGIITLASFFLTTFLVAQDPNLVLDLKFDDAAGSTATDDSLYGNDGTIYFVEDDAATKTLSTTNWGVGLFGGALETDGIEFQSNTTVEIPTSASLQGVAQEITIMAWVYRDDILKNASVFTHDYTSMFFGFHNSLYKWQFDTDAPGNVRGSCYAGYTPLNEWVHLAATYDGTTARLFANGVEVCTKTLTGNLIINTTNPDTNFTSFTSSGFYEPLADPDPSYNHSGITDELDGRIDELKVYDKILTPAEIKVFYDLGQVLPGVQDCPVGTIVSEYKIGTAGTWIEGNSINANLGDEIFIRAKDFVTEYFVTIPENDGNTNSSLTDFVQADGYQIGTNTTRGDNDGLVDINDVGQYVLTTPEGCPVVITLNLDCAAIGQYPEYRINSEPWVDGATAVTIDEGAQLMLSTFPNNLPYSITLPDGSIENVGLGDYTIPNVAAVHDGIFTFTLLDSGCSVDLDVTVTPVDCNTVQQQYSINSGPYINGATAVTVDEGVQLALSVFPDDLPYNITLPDASVVTVGLGDYTIPNITQADAGIYTLTTIGSGCTVDLDVTVTPVDCNTVQQQYSINSGPYIDGATAVTVDEGVQLALSVFPNDLPYTITLPDASVVTVGLGDYTIPNITQADAGIYTFTTIGSGCTVDLDVTVTPVDCNTVQQQYSINSGPYIDGATAVTVDEGVQLALSVFPDDLPYTITLPDASVVTVGLGDYTIPNITQADAGIYTFTTIGSGCIVDLDVTVTPVDCTTVLQQYSINSGSYIDGATVVTVDEGVQLALSVFPDDRPYTITLPDASVVTVGLGDYTIPSITQADAGIYTFTTIASGCSSDLNVNVNDPTCTTLGLIPEYSINGATAISGQSPLSITAGDAISLGILPDGTAFSVSGPNGNNKVLDLNDLVLTNSSVADSGTYTFTAAGGCYISLDITVTSFDCGTLGLLTESSVNGGTSVSGLSTLSVIEGDAISLGILPDGTAFSVSAPNGNDKVLDLNDLVIASSTVADSGTYTFTTFQGCSVTLDLTVTPFDCGTLGLLTESSVNGGASVSGLSTLSVIEGDALTLSILPDGMAFSVAGPNGNDKALDVNDLVITSSTVADSGTYTFTTVEGCSVTLDLTVTPFDCGTLGLLTESSVNGGASVSGLSTLSVIEGDALTLSILPDGMAFSVAGPNGNDKALDVNDLVITSSTVADSGTYTFTTVEGCSVTLDLTVTPFDCGTLGLLTESSVNGGASVSGLSTLSVIEGDALTLSILPDGMAFSVAGPNGNDKALDVNDLVITSSTVADSGTYTFTTVEGCSVTLDLTVTPFDCGTLGLLTESSVNGGASVSGLSTLSVIEGDAISLGILPDGTAFSVAGPNGNDKALDVNDLVITSSTVADSGTYTFTTFQGCSVTLDLTVTPFDCGTLGLLTESSVNGGASVSGLSTLSVIEGDALTLSILPDGMAFSVAGPNGNDKALDVNDLVITSSTVADSGTYTFTTVEGCSVTLDLTVTPFDCGTLGLLTESSVNGGASVSGLSTLSVIEGDALTLSILPDGMAFSVAGPNGNDKALDVNDLVITSSTVADSGTYTFTTVEGCSVTLNVEVLEIQDSGTLEDLILYPIPVNDILNFDLGNYMNDSFKVQLHDIYGKTIIKSDISKDSNGVGTLDVSGLSDGTYILIIESFENDEVVFKKIIKL